MSRRSNQQGFSAVELLITLFVGVAFLGAAFQLYSAVVNDGGEARFRARASNLAYINLRQAAASTSASCNSTSSNTNGTSGSAYQLDSPTVTITTAGVSSCANGNLIKITATVQYGPSNNRQEVSHAIFVSR